MTSMQLAHSSPRRTPGPSVFTAEQSRWAPAFAGATKLCISLFVMLALAFIANNAIAQAIDPLPFRDHAEELRFQHLTSELRCLVCQDENLADSNADFARDLRHKVFELMQQGKNDAQIKQYLVDRYSDFVLYDPPINHRTWLLWFGPLLILIAGGIVVVNTIRKRSRIAAPTASAPTDNGDDW
jgi:cytochrome c-type biogenesis protein CcmH